MRLQRIVSPALTGALAIAGIASALAAQGGRAYPAPAPSARIYRLSEDQPRSALGITTSASTSNRDTLGLLVSSVVRNSPADRAGIEEGNRIASINGVSLRISAADAGDWETNQSMSRRLTRELERVRPGDEVELRVYASGQYRTLRVRTADSDSLYGRRRSLFTEDEDRPSLGISVGSTGSRRDTLGVFVMFVDDSGPAARAGIEEGNRIASINGTDLRVTRDDADDEFFGSSRVRRLQREITRLHPGDDVELRVYGNGRFRTVHLRAARASEMSRRHRAFTITGDGVGAGMILPRLRGMDLGVDGAGISDEVRRAIERAMQSTGRAFEGFGRSLDNVRIRGFDRRFDDDDDPPSARWEQIEPLKIEPLKIGPLAPRVPVPAVTPRAIVRTVDVPDSGHVWAMPALAGTVARSRGLPFASATGTAVNVAGLRLVPIGEQLASYLGRGSERGLLVIEVPDWASRAVHPGDVVMRIDGEAVRCGDHYDSVSVALPRNRDARLEILRDGEPRTVTLPARR